MDTVKKKITNADSENVFLIYVSSSQSEVVGVSGRPNQWSSECDKLSS